jgi:hypothetical protein
LECGIAFLLFVVSRAITSAALPDGSLKVATTVIGSIVDLIVAVLFLTFFRVLYGFAFIFVRQPLARIGNFVLFTLIFGTVFTLRTGQALGVEKIGNEVKVYFPFPKSPQVETRETLGMPEIKDEGLATVLRIRGETLGTTITFVPAYNVDRKSKERLRQIEAALKDAKR